MTTVTTTDRRTSVYAILSFFLGLFWFFWVGSILGVLLGHLARREIRQEGLGGDTWAIWGLIFSYMGIVTLAFTILSQFH